MAEPRVLILGHSFIRRLHELVRLPTNALREDFDITSPMNLRWHGVGRMSVQEQRPTARSLEIKSQAQYA